MGNPLSYRDGMKMAWQCGRELASVNVNDSEISYKYNLDGMRTQKNCDGTVTNYYYDENNNLIGLTKGNKTLFFYYDSNGNVTYMTDGQQIFFYVKNLQGDIIKIINESGIEYATYSYDALGNILMESGEPILRVLNLFRYRGYIYDEETGLYYLKSRYYDPVTGRFLNADDTEFIGATGTILSTNMFAYCENNAVNKVDLGGFISTSTKNVSKNELKLVIKFSDKDIRKIKLGIGGFAIVFDAVCAAIGLAGGIPSLGISIFASGIAAVVVSTISGLSLAIIDYYDHGKGAKIVVHIKYGYNTIKYVKWKKTKKGWKITLKKKKIPYAYISKGPTIKWIK